MADYCNGGAPFTDDASLADMAHTGQSMETRLKPVNAVQAGSNGCTVAEQLPPQFGSGKHRGFSWKAKK